jgi:hypothetical protein
MSLRETIGRVLALLDLVFAVVGIIVLEGISIEFPGIILGAWVRWLRREGYGAKRSRS